MKAHTSRILKVQKNAEILSDILEYSCFFVFFEVFHIKLSNPT